MTAGTHTAVLPPDAIQLAVDQARSDELITYDQSWQRRSKRRPEGDGALTLRPSRQPVRTAPLRSTSRGRTRSKPRRHWSTAPHRPAHQPVDLESATNFRATCRWTECRVGVAEVASARNSGGMKRSINADLVMWVMIGPGRRRLLCAQPGR